MKDEYYARKKAVKNNTRMTDTNQENAEQTLNTNTSNSLETQIN